MSLIILFILAKVYNSKFSTPVPEKKKKRFIKSFGNISGHKMTWTIQCRGKEEGGKRKSVKETQ